MEAKSVDVNDFLDWVLPKGHKPIDALGNFDGSIQLSGPFNQISLKSHLESYNGHIKSLNYDSMILQLQGIYPNVEVANSTITQKNGFSFNIDGPIDLSDRKNFSSQISALKRSALVKKDHAESEWVIKSVKSGDDEKSTEVNYFLRKDDGFGGTKQEDSGMVGVKQKIGF